MMQEGWNKPAKALGNWQE